MSPADWWRVIDEVAQLGGRMVQIIGGEPTLYRGLPYLVHRALGQGLEVEVFSNLVRVSSELWEAFAHRGGRLATSYYTDDAAEHEAITKGRDSHARTKANITEALRRSIPLRVGLVDVQDCQRIEQARAELVTLGVTEIGTDHLRQVGRGIRQLQPSIDQLCGHCAPRKVAVSPNGDVWPCVFARWMLVGNVASSGPHSVDTATSGSTAGKRSTGIFTGATCCNRSSGFSTGIRNSDDFPDLETPLRDHSERLVS